VAVLVTDVAGYIGSHLVRCAVSCEGDNRAALEQGLSFLIEPMTNHRRKDMPIRLSTIVRQSKDQIFCNLNEEFAILSLKSTLYYGLDEIGGCIWQALSEPRSAAEICRTVRERFEVDEGQYQIEILEFLTELQEAGLIECADDGSLG
jgi:hypothetical protein